MSSRPQRWVVAVAATALVWTGVSTVLLPDIASALVTKDVTMAPYNANTTGTVNDRAAIQQAINDVNAAGGGRSCCLAAPRRRPRNTCQARPASTTATRTTTHPT